jgi:hypothetical protein
VGHLFSDNRQAVRQDVATNAAVFFHRKLRSIAKRRENLSLFSHNPGAVVGS